METCVEISCQIASLESEKSNAYKKSFTDALREKYGSGDKDCNYIVDGVFINLVVGRSPSKNGSDAEFAHLRNVVRITKTSSQLTPHNIYDICMCVCMNICMCVCTYMYMCVCMYT